MTTTPLSDTELLIRLHAITPELFVEPELLAEWSRDQWPPEAKMAVDADLLPAAAVMPADVEELVAVVKLAASAGRPLIPRGGGSGLTGGLEPLPGAIVVDVCGLNVIDPVNEVNATVRVDAGVHGGELAKRLAEQGYALGHEPESLSISTVGGWIATRSTGAFATGLGGIARFMVSLEVVLADGSTIAVSTGDQAGPALAELFIGSEGALGIVTSVTFRVRPIPEARRFRAFAFSSFLDGLDALRKLTLSGIVPAATKLLDESETLAFAFYALIAVQGNLLFTVFEGPAALAEVQERLTIDRFTGAGAVDLGAEPAEFWNGERLSPIRFFAGNEGDGSMEDRIDLFVPWDRVEAIVARGSAALTDLGVAFGIDSSQVLSHGADLCFGFAIEAEDGDAALDLHEAAWTAIMEIALSEGARIAHRHGYGQARIPWLARDLGPSHATLIAIKHALDPLGIMNPGRLLL